MIRALFRVRAMALAAVVLLVVASRAHSAATITDPPVLAAETRLRLEVELGSTRIQRTVAAGVNTVMTTRPSTTFRLRNAVRAANNTVAAATREETARLAVLLRNAIDELISAGAVVVDVSRLFDLFDTEIADQFNALAAQGTRDISGLVRNGRRIPSVRGLLVGNYELFVSQPENGREPVKLGNVSLGESQLVRGLISTDAAAEFFLGGMPGPTPKLADLPATTALRGIRWLNRGGTLAISAPDSLAQTFVGASPDLFSIRGVDLLPERLRIELERMLEGSTDIASNIDGADGFFRSVTYTFRRITETPGR